jgi:hypothetical protein
MALNLREKLLNSFNTAKANVGYIAGNFRPAIQANIQRPVQNFMNRPVPQRLQPAARMLEKPYNTNNPAVRLPLQFGAA